MSLVRTACAAAMWLLLAMAGGALARPFGIDDVLRVQEVSDARISPDGDWVVYQVGGVDLAGDKRGSSQLWLVSWDGATSLALTQGEHGASNPRWSPDGRRIGFLRKGDGEHDDDQVWVLDRRGGEAARLTDLRGGVSGFEWSPDGKKLALLHAPKPPEPKKDANGKEIPQPIVIDRYQFKNDGDSYVHVQVPERIYLYDIQGKRLAALSTGEGYIRESQPAWSPDGRRIAFVGRRGPEAERTDYDDLFVAEATPGAEPRALTDFPGEDTGPPVWSPDGKHIAFLRGDQPRYWLYNQLKVALVAANGYAVVQINYRGSSGRGTEFGRGIFADWGNRDVSDLLAGVDHVVGMGVADPSRLVVGGWSQGASRPTTSSRATAGSRPR